MRLLKNINGTAIEVPKEMASMFNIKSDSLSIIRRLGEGSYGAVFLAKNAEGKLVAVKKLTGSMLASAASDFFREAALMVGAFGNDSRAKKVPNFLTPFLLRLGIPPHKNCVRVHGLVQEVSNFSLVMEYLPNGSLDTYSSKLIFESGQNWDQNILCAEKTNFQSNSFAHIMYFYFYLFFAGTALCWESRAECVI